MKRVYVRRKLNESQGIDDQVIIITKEITDKVVKQFEEIKSKSANRRLFTVKNPYKKFRLEETLFVNTGIRGDEGERATLTYPITVTVGCFDEMTKRAHTECAAAIGTLLITYLMTGRTDL